ncbi:hypothetical protein C0Q58_14210 [Streptomyces albidoflavus]|uniref:hypothetical protein n=1 Tax=Streptomyces albidoflavus TaxID=1886 RepID=UPI00101E5C30|nr:hypothetical protein [Streptomyces albidoflavus]RZD62894.1 hypothetical protein C0Q58_14210 [Streptomyces albidoflavus]
MEHTASTVLQAVLDRHGAHCACRGACGKTHGRDGVCRRPEQFGRPPLSAGPYPPRPTDRQNIAVPAADLVPWCGPCWRRALDTVRAAAAAERRARLEALQEGLFADGELEGAA